MSHLRAMCSPASWSAARPDYIPCGDAQAGLMMHLMPAKNPRLTITLEPELSACLKRLSALSGNSQASIISELLDGSAPVFHRLIRVLEAAQEARDAVRGKLAEDMEQAQVRLESQLGLVLGEFDDLADSLTRDAERVKRRARRAPGGAAIAAARAPAAHASTPLSNRGVRSQTKTPKTQAKTRT